MTLLNFPRFLCIFYSHLTTQNFVNPPICWTPAGRFPCRWHASNKSWISMAQPAKAVQTATIHKTVQRRRSAASHHRDHAPGMTLADKMTLTKFKYQKCKLLFLFTLNLIAATTHECDLLASILSRVCFASISRSAIIDSAHIIYRRKCGA